jgi:hypothetical protein
MFNSNDKYLNCKLGLLESDGNEYEMYASKRIDDIVVYTGNESPLIKADLNSYHNQQQKTTQKIKQIGSLKTTKRFELANKPGNESNLILADCLVIFLFVSIVNLFLI